MLSAFYYYFRQGYPHVSFPLTFVGLSTSIYYLAIENVPFLKELFPKFRFFLLVTGFGLAVFCGVAGFMYVNLYMYRVGSKINLYSSPYHIEIIPPVQIPLYRKVAEICEKQGVDASELWEMIERSEKDD
jgi:hypothetical protein